MTRYKSKQSEERLPLPAGSRFKLTYSVFKTGAKGEKMVLGGTPAMVGICGGPNNFKSALAIYLAGYGMDKVNASTEAWLELYDTEATMLYDRLASLTKEFTYFPDDIFDPASPLWTITSSASYLGDEWLSHMKEVLKEKVKDKSAYSEYPALFGKEKKLVPTVNVVDTLSKLDSVKSNKLLLDSKAEGTDTNMYFMSTGLMKSKFMAYLPRLINTSACHFILTAHLGKKKEMKKGPFDMPEKKVSYLGSDKKIRGVPDEFLELPQIVYEAKNGKKFMNQATKLPEFPNGTNNVGVDLHTVKMLVIRNKGGLTGTEFTTVFKQSGGLHEQLTDLLFLKEKYPGHENLFGIGGNDRNYHILWCPDVSLSRTTFREKVENDPKVSKALELMADLRQLIIFRPEQLTGYKTDPAEIYQAIIDNGFSWDEILETRSWDTPNQYDPKLPNYLSILGLLEMANGVKQYWHK